MNIQEFFRTIHPKPSDRIVSNRNELPYFSKNYHDDLPFHYGHYQFDCLGGLNVSLWDLLTQEAIGDNVQVEEVLFLDLETTGLSGGTGTIPFLVGLAFISGRQLIIEQFVLNELSALHHMLGELTNRCSSFRWLVTYNGKSFDASIIRSQYRLNRLGESPLDSMSHFDLLHICRRIWKNEYPSFQLGQIETYLVGHHRQDDLPGALIPEYYFRYLRSYDRRIILPILEHNYFDLKSLVGIFLRINDLMESPVHCEIQICNIIDASFRFKKFSRGHQWIQDILMKLLPDVDQKRILRGDGYLLKKMGCYEEAREIWEEVCDCEALLELAKLYEHSLKNPGRALECARQARSFLVEQENQAYFFNHSRDQQRVNLTICDLDKRILRLEKRVKV